MPRILTATALAVGLVALTVGHAAGQSASGPLWATVNVCSPNEVGVRASLPGNGTRQRMQVRFTAQWFSQSRGWVPVEGVPSSPWLSAGSAEYLYRQAGWTFAFDPPPAGTHFQVRGLAEMRWLNGGRVVRRVTRVTQAGAVGVDVGSSGASCAIG